MTSWRTAVPRLARRVAAAFLVAAALAFVFGSNPSGPAGADTRGELLVSPSHARVDDLVTVTVIDPDVDEIVLNESETADFTGNPYVLAPGAAGDLQVFRVKNAPIADLNGDGAVDVQDIVAEIAGANVLWLAPESGTFGLLRNQPNPTPVSFTVTYRHSQVDAVPVKVTSPSDPSGFSLTLRETHAQSGTFVATFKTGDESSLTNIDDPEASVRPVIEAADGQLVNLEYSDSSPLTIITNSVLIDTTLPLVTALSPGHGEATRNVSVWVRATVTDDGSGVDISEIRFHADIDRDGVFDAAEEVVASELDSTPVNQGWDAIALLPPVAEDGPVKWYVTATDRGGNIGRSDADPSEEGTQNHTATVDTVPPRPEVVYMGGAYDEEAEEILVNHEGQMRVVFEEDIDPESVIPERFVFGAGNVAVSGYVHEDHPDTVWLTFEELSSIVDLLTVLPGAVKDVAGFPAELSIIEPVDQLGPILKVVPDKSVTNGIVSVSVTSPEALGSPPSLTINGVTYGKMIELSSKKWTLEIDASTLTGAASGQGVKNVQVAGLDAAGNAARGGQSPDSPTYPENAVRFEYDSSIKSPAIVPGQGDIASSSSPVIVVTYADEPEEYVGDSHASVTIVSAKLDGFDVTSLMKSTTSTSWMYQPASLSQGEHNFSVQGRDDAGNIHGPNVVRFTVDAPPPTPTPAPTATPTPTAVPVDEPGEDPPPELQPEGSPTPTPEASVTPTVTPIATPSESAGPTTTPTPEGLTEADLQATVTAIRQQDEEEDAQTPPNVLTADTGYTVFGCGLPAGNGVAAVGDYMVVGLGLLGMIVLKRRRQPADSLNAGSQKALGVLPDDGN